MTYLRNMFSSLLITGPFSILIGFDGGMMALNDRLKLRSMVVGEKGDRVYMASEECAIRIVEPELDAVLVAQRRRSCDCDVGWRCEHNAHRFLISGI